LSGSLPGWKRHPARIRIERGDAATKFQEGNPPSVRAEVSAAEIAARRYGKPGNDQLAGPGVP
jgi:hypothetical protein